jgi:hypothetical protein
MSNANDEISAFLTPVPVPREDTIEGKEQEGHLSGCAAENLKSGRFHIFLNTREQQGHNLCQIRSESYGDNFTPCEPRNVRGNRFWDFRDRSDYRSNPEKPPYDAIIDYLGTNIPEDYRKNIYTFRSFTHSVIILLALRPDLGQRIYGPLFPKLPIEGLLRSRCLPKRQKDGISKTVRVDEGIIFNKNSLL